MVDILAMTGVLPLAGRLDVDLYRFYSVAAVLGWLAGNVFVFRTLSAPPSRLRRRLGMVYLLGPPAFLFLLRAAAPAAEQAAAPLVPVYGTAVYALFFLVPITFRGRRPRRPGDPTPSSRA